MFACRKDENCIIPLAYLRDGPTSLPWAGSDLLSKTRTLRLLCSKLDLNSYNDGDCTSRAALVATDCRSSIAQFNIIYVTFITCTFSFTHCHWLLPQSRDGATDCGCCWTVSANIFGVNCFFSRLICSSFAIGMRMKFSSTFVSRRVKNQFLHVTFNPSVFDCQPPINYRCYAFCIAERTVLDAVIILFVFFFLVSQLIVYYDLWPIEII